MVVLKLHALRMFKRGPAGVGKGVIDHLRACRRHPETEGAAETNRRVSAQTDARLGSSEPAWRQQRGDPPPPTAEGQAATPAPRSPCTRCRTAARRKRPPRHTHLRPRRTRQSEARRREPARHRTAGAEKSSPQASAPCFFARTGCPGRCGIAGAPGVSPSRSPLRRASERPRRSRQCEPGTRPGHNLLDEHAPGHSNSLGSAPATRPSRRRLPPCRWVAVPGRIFSRPCRANVVHLPASSLESGRRTQPPQIPQRPWATRRP